jgi:hypothetical protein
MWGRNKEMSTNDRENIGKQPLRGADSFSKKSAAFKDLVIILGVSVIIFVLSAFFDVFNKAISWIYRHDTWQLDELFTVAVYLAVAISIYAWRRHRELLDEYRHRQKAEAEKAELVPELERALADVTTLRTLLPICSSCKRIRDPKGYWDPVEVYIENHTSAKINDGLCPDCARKMYGG